MEGVSGGGHFMGASNHQTIFQTRSSEGACVEPAWEVQRIEIYIGVRNTKREDTQRPYYT